MTHQLADEPAKTQTEPASLAEAARVLIVLAVGAGWLSTGQANTLTVALSALGVVASVALTWWTRRKVTSLARPRNADGTPLIPSAPPTRLAE